jgi:hypothetical protein
MLANAPSALATKLTGTLAVTDKFVEKVDALKKKRAKKITRGYWNEPNPLKQIAPPKVDLSSDFGVVLFKEGADKPKADPVKTVKVYTGSLEKNVTVIRPTSRIKFLMTDPYDHELYSPGKHDFKPQKQAQNSFRPVDFYSAGIFEVKCKLIPHLHGWIVVVPATYVLEVKKNGNFELNDLDSGKYKIKVFFDGNWIYEKKFNIEREREVKIDIKLKDIAPLTVARDTDKKNESDGSAAGKKGKKGKTGPKKAAENKKQ